MAFQVSSGNLLWPSFLDNLYHDLEVADTAGHRRGAAAGFVEPAYSYTNQNGNVYLEIELPGVKREDLAVEAEGQKLTVTGKRFTGKMKSTGKDVDTSNGAPQEEKKDEETQPKQEETKATSYRKMFTVPGGSDLNSVKADYNDGLLRLMIPARAGIEGGAHPIQIGM